MIESFSIINMLTIFWLMGAKFPPALEVLVVLYVFTQIIAMNILVMSWYAIQWLEKMFEKV